MVKLEKNGDSAIRFTFTDSDHYLYKDGYIDVPINSLSLVIDESEMVTFKKSATGDPFLSFRADNSNLGTKEAIEQFYKENMVGAGGGISEEEVQDMIDSATSGIPSSQVIEALRNDINTVSGEVDTKQDALEYYSEAEYPAGGGRGMILVYNGKTYISSVEADASTTDGGTYAKLYAKGEASSNALKVSPTGVTINDAKVLTENDINPNDLWEKEEVIASALTEVRQDVADIDAKEEVIASALTEVRQNVDTLSGDVQTKADLSAVTAVSNDLNTLSGAVIDNEYTVSQSLNDLNSRKLDASAYTPTDLSQYWTSAQTQSAIDDAKAYYVDFAAMSVQGITDADWDGLVAAINAHRPILVKVGTANGYVNATTAGIFDNTIIVTGADEGNASKYTFTKNGSNDYSVSTSTKNFVSQTEKDAWNAKQDALSAGTGIEISGNVISAIGGGSVTVDDALSTTSENPVANSAITTAINAKQDALYVYTENRDLATAELHSNDSSLIFSAGGASITANNPMGVNTFNVAGNGVTINNDRVLTEGDVTSAITSASTNDEVAGAKAVYDTLGGLKLVKISQADWDVLATKDNDTLYIIPDGDGGRSD